MLRPGGHLVISDIDPERVALGSIPHRHDPDGRPIQMSGYRHLIGDYLRAALSAGLHVRSCEEPLPPRPNRTAEGPEHQTTNTPEPQQPESEPLAPIGPPGPWELWPWTLIDLVPEAAHAASADLPTMVIWHFQAAEA